MFVKRQQFLALSLMYLKASFRHNPAINDIAAYYRLVESYRNEFDRVCHKTLLNIGFWADVTREQKDKVVDHLNERYKNELALFEETDLQVVEWVNRFWNEMIAKKTIDRKTMEEKHRLVKADTIKHKEAREIGTEWICANTWNQLQLTELFENLGWSEEKIQLAMTQVISRAVYPGSELATSKWIKDNSAICDITGYDIDKITKDKLYQSALDLYKHKAIIEKHLSTTTNELFDLQDRIMLYDLTNTYFEGTKRNSQLAKYGRSKEKRSDAKLVVLAMVINIEGFIKYSAIHEGNYADTSDIKTLIEKLSCTTSTAAKPIVVMDAGIATEKNLATLTQQGYKYVVVSRSKIKDYQPVQNGKETYLLTKSKKIIRLSLVQSEKYTDSFLKVESPAKGMKEQGIKNRLEQGYEEQLNLIKQSLSKPRGVKKADKVQQRIGRAKQKYPSVHHLYNISFDIDTATQTVKNIYWQKDMAKAEEANKKLGVYFLRTNLDDLDEALEWMIYNTIREIESTFKILKTDLDLRPIYHKNDTATMAHLHLGLLAYWLVNTIRHQLKQSGINDDWKEIKRKASTQKSVLTTAQNSYNKIIQIKRCTEPTEDLKQIHSALKQQKAKPYKQIKFVVHKPPPKKSETQAIAKSAYG
ncbi:MAG: IS1634 family transposase [Bacteroidota bacterium]|nr:IS1634 family transposase [Bacteroidota bacterium]